MVRFSVLRSPVTAAAAIALLIGLAAQARATPVPSRIMTPAARLAWAALYGNSCVRHDGRPECVAVGTALHGQVYPGLVEVSTGQAWTSSGGFVTPPAPHDVTSGQEVSCVSVPRKQPDCMVVGVHYNFGKTVDQVAEWGPPGRLRIVVDRNPAGAIWSNLQDVSCPTSRFCMLVGSSGRTRSSSYPTAYLWNGRSLRKIAAPIPPRSRLGHIGALSCPTTRICMAVGGYTNAGGVAVSYAATWHNGRWSLRGLAGVKGAHGVFVNAVSCPKASFCLAVGVAVSGKADSQIAYEWNGRAWRLENLPVSAQSSMLNSVSCPAPGTCVVAGSVGSAALAEQRSKADVWEEMKVVAVSRPEVSVFFHVACLSMRFCTAVGSRYNPKYQFSARTLAEQWNGTAWTLEASANT